MLKLNGGKLVFSNLLRQQRSGASGLTRRSHNVSFPLFKDREELAVHFRAQESMTAFPVFMGCDSIDHIEKIFPLNPLNSQLPTYGVVLKNGQEAFVNASSDRKMFVENLSSYKDFNTPILDHKTFQLFYFKPYGDLLGVSDYISGKNYDCKTLQGGHGHNKAFHL